jgi:hypothetical protein
MQLFALICDLGDFVRCSKKEKLNMNCIVISFI